MFWVRPVRPRQDDVLGRIKYAHDVFHVEVVLPPCEDRDVLVSLLGEFGDTCAQKDVVAVQGDPEVLPVRHRLHLPEDCVELNGSPCGVPCLLFQAIGLIDDDATCINKLIYINNKDVCEPILHVGLQLARANASALIRVTD